MTGALGPSRCLALNSGVPWRGDRPKWAEGLRLRERRGQPTSSVAACRPRPDTGPSLAVPPARRSEVSGVGSRVPWPWVEGAPCFLLSGTGKLRGCGSRERV